MRYLASEKLEIIRLVEESVLPVRRTLEKIGIPRATFYRWYYLYQAGGPVELLVLAGHLPRDAQENPNFRPVRQAKRIGARSGDEAQRPEFHPKTTSGEFMPSFKPKTRQPLSKAELGHN